MKYIYAARIDLVRDPDSSDQRLGLFATISVTGSRHIRLEIGQIVKIHSKHDFPAIHYRLTAHTAAIQCFDEDFIDLSRLTNRVRRYLPDPDSVQKTGTILVVDFDSEADAISAMQLIFTPNYDLEISSAPPIDDGELF